MGTAEDLEFKTIYSSDPEKEMKDFSHQVFNNLPLASEVFSHQYFPILSNHIRIFFESKREELSEFTDTTSLSRVDEISKALSLISPENGFKSYNLHKIKNGLLEKTLVSATGDAADFRTYLLNANCNFISALEESGISRRSAISGLIESYNIVRGLNKLKDDAKDIQDLLNTPSISMEEADRLGKEFARDLGLVPDEDGTYRDSDEKFRKAVAEVDHLEVSDVLGDLVSTLSSFSTRAKEKNIIINLEKKDIIVKAFSNKEKLRSEIFRNLTENALRYAPKSSVFHVRVEKQPKEETVTITFTNESDLTTAPSIGKNQNKSDGCGYGLVRATELLRDWGGDLKCQYNKRTKAVSFIVTLLTSDLLNL